MSKVSCIFARACIFINDFLLALASKPDVTRGQTARDHLHSREGLTRGNQEFRKGGALRLVIRRNRRVVPWQDLARNFGCDVGKAEAVTSRCRPSLK